MCVLNYVLPSESVADQMIPAMRSEGRPLDLIGVGECMVEFWADAPLGEAREFHRSYGGDVMNSLVAASRLGSRAGFISKVGDDPFGASLQGAWQAEGIDLRYCPLVEGTNGVYFIAQLEGGERDFTYYRLGSPASTLEPADVDESYVASSRLLLLSGITQAISKSAEAATLHAAEVARESGVVVAFDPNYRAKLWQARGVLEGVESGQALAQEVTRTLLPFVDILLLSAPADLEALEDSVGELAERLPLICVKRGEQGCTVYEEGSRIDLPPVNSDVVDTTGAGDAWNGAFLHGLLRGDVAEAGELANRVAARSVAYRGAVPPD